MDYHCRRNQLGSFLMRCKSVVYDLWHRPGGPVVELGQGPMLIFFFWRLHHNVPLAFDARRFTRWAFPSQLVRSSTRARLRGSTGIVVVLTIVGFSAMRLSRLRELGFAGFGCLALSQFCVLRFVSGAASL